VYNHLGVEGNTLIQFAKDYLTDSHKTDWGSSIHFDLSPVKEFFLSNALYWIEEYRFDGLRLDATPFIFPQEVLQEFRPLTNRLLFAENEQQNARLVHSYQFDGMWNDDFHHSAHVRLTGKREAYYSDYFGSAQEFISLIKYGFLYQGQYYSWQKNKRGTPAFSLLPEQFIVFLENHDQIANTGTGNRLCLLADAAIYRAMTCYFLLCPQTILLFQGQEFNATTPFFYFAEHSPKMNELVRKGHKKGLLQFPSLTKTIDCFPNPSDPKTFERSKLDFSERKTNESFYRMFKSLLNLRKRDPVFKKSVKIDGAVLNSDCFIIRYFGEAEDRLLIVNFGVEIRENSIPEPLIAPRNETWQLLWSSDDPKFGGAGIAPFSGPTWKIPGHAALVLQ
jgi:maltooligosyltrehalose trehalohydrolase